VKNRGNAAMVFFLTMPGPSYILMNKLNFPLPYPSPTHSPFPPLPPSPSANKGIDFYMLAVTLLVETDKSMCNDGFARIRPQNEENKRIADFASHERVTDETKKIGNETLRKKVIELLGFAEAAGICINEF
jgi:hypothetical protein